MWHGWRELDPLLNRQCLVMRAHVTGNKIVVFHRWPQDGSPELGRHLNPQVIELGAATSLHVREVNEEGVEADALRCPVGRLCGVEGRR